MRLSISKIKMFKSCRRQYELHYLEGLTPVQTSDALLTGRRYHEIIADLYSDKIVENDYSKEAAMAEAYCKYILPNFDVKSVEAKLTYDMGNGDELIGFADGIAEDGSIVEHKTVSREIDEGYEYDLMWDQQILAYMLTTGSRKVYYTACRKPTIRQKQNETEEEFYNRMVEWYDTDTEKKIRLLELYRTDEEITEFERGLYAMLDEMKNCKNFYKNQSYCNMWGRRCEYAPVCLHYDPNQDYIEFEKKEVNE
jgi:hypothetical protein